ncbi:hypothetical protein CAEBREN_13321 [Caenorhabditis brenneri]|uniref:GATA-type domain-containing protein n=1 Tax=Caenorhabditis brenneri TaxID=135651 RepID=G0NI21_CAEBE|nr:hypothetical protein CAEBREN_13321 [Caenorhabditis brenneri]
MVSTNVAASLASGAVVSSCHVTALLSPKLSKNNTPASNSSNSDAGESSPIDWPPQNSTFFQPGAFRPVVSTPKVGNCIKWSIDSILDNTPSSAAPEPVFAVQSGDGQVFSVSKKILHKSKALQNLAPFMTNYGKGLGQMQVLPLHNFDGRTLKMVFNWCENYTEDPTITGDNLATSLTASEFEKKFLDGKDVSQAFNVASAALYLDIESLVRFASDKIAGILDGNETKDLPHTTSGAQPTSTPIQSTPVQFAPMPPTPMPFQSNSLSTPTIKSSHTCSHCGVQQSCKWRNILSPQILCNACYIYQRKYNKVRPATAAASYKRRMAEKTID